MQYLLNTSFYIYLNILSGKIIKEVPESTKAFLTSNVELPNFVYLTGIVQ